MNAAKMPARVLYVENAEGDGHCGHCQRDNLKYVAHMSDGAMVGLSCARKLMGVRITNRDVAWTAGYKVIATRTEGVHFFALWINEDKHVYVTQNGYRTDHGYIHLSKWKNKGWL